MFGRLLKHELLANIKVISIVCGIIVALGVLLGLLINIPDLPVIVVEILIIAIFIGLLVAYVLAIVHVFNTFGKNTFEKRGYVTFQIPACSHEIVGSKILGCLIFFALVTVAGIISLLIVAFSIDSALQLPEGGVSLVQIVSESLFTDTFVLDLVFGAISLINTMTSLIFIFALINTGSFKGNKLVLTIVLYFVVGFVTSVIFALDPINLAFIKDVSGQYIITGIENVPETILWGINIFEYIIYVVESIIFYFVTVFLLDSKLELE